MNKVPFVEREPTAGELERFRLLLSTYQDGTGMLSSGMLSEQDDRTWPGWRDFERALALSFGGISIESKWYYDVLLPAKSQENLYYGISCKMKEELGRRGKKGEAYIEVTNTDGQIWKTLNRVGVTKQNLSEYPELAGTAILRLVESWRLEATQIRGLLLDSRQGVLLTLQYSLAQGDYQLVQYPSALPDPQTLSWEAAGTTGRTICGKKDGRVVIEYFGYSGSQLKYYPLFDEAIWQSERFRLAPLPIGLEPGIINRAKSYFPGQWAATTDL